MEADPSLAFLQTMMSLYFTNKVRPNAGEEEVKTLPPMEALVLGMMCLNKRYNSDGLNIRLKSFRFFDDEERGIFCEMGILNLVRLGYLKPASQTAEDALTNRDREVWGLSDIPFIVTANGAKRIGYLVANLKGEKVEEVIERIQAESKEAAKAWEASQLSSRP